MPYVENAEVLVNWPSCLASTPRWVVFTAAARAGHCHWGRMNTAGTPFLGQLLFVATQFSPKLTKPHSVSAARGVLLRQDILEVWLFLTLIILGAKNWMATESNAYQDLYVWRKLCKNSSPVKRKEDLPWTEKIASDRFQAKKRWLKRMVHLVNNPYTLKV